MASFSSEAYLQKNIWIKSKMDIIICNRLKYEEIVA